MKTVIMIITLFAASVSHANDQYITEIIADCNTTAQMAEEIMQVRQAGKNLSQLAKEIAESNTPENSTEEGVKGLMSLILLVYEMPVTTTSTRIRDLTFQGCYEGKTK